MLSAIFKALGDDTRRALLTQLCQQGPCRVTDLASHYAMSLNGISKHLKVLEETGLVTRKTMGREHWIEADTEKLVAVQEWFKDLNSMWSQSLEQLNNAIGKKDE